MVISQLNFCYVQAMDKIKTVSEIAWTQLLYGIETYNR